MLCALCGFDDFGAGFERAHQACDGLLDDYGQMRLKLGEGLLDVGHVGAVGRQKAQFHDGGLDQSFDLRSPVCGQIIQDDNVAFRSRRNEAICTYSSRRAALIGRSQTLDATIARRLRLQGERPPALVPNSDLRPRIS